MIKTITIATALLAGQAFAVEKSNIEVFERKGDIVYTEGETSRRLVTPPDLQQSGRFVIRMKRDKEAAKTQKEVNLEDQIQARKLVFQANAAFFKGELEKAWELVDKAENLAPNDYRVLTMKGSLLFRIGSKDLAKEVWQKSLSINPNQQEILKYGIATNQK